MLFLADYHLLRDEYLSLRGGSGILKQESGALDTVIQWSSGGERRVREQGESEAAAADGTHSYGWQSHDPQYLAAAHTTASAGQAIQAYPTGRGDRRAARTGHGQAIAA